MKFPLKLVAVAVSASTLLATSPAFAEQKAPIDPLACTPEEIQAVMKEYNDSLGTIDKYHVPNFEQFKEVNMAVKANDPDEPDGLCEILANTKYEIPELDMSAVTEAWNKLKLLMAGSSAGAGVDWNKVISEAYAKGMEKAKETFLAGSCKLAQNFSSSANESIDDAWEDGKDMAKDEVENNDKVNDVGISDLDKPLWKQVAEKENEERLGDYADYAKWYEGDFDKENTDESVDALVDKIIGDKTEDILDENIKGGTGDSIDDILDGLEPDYG